MLAIALTALRVVNITTGFQKETKYYATMDRGIEEISRGARIFRLIDASKDHDDLDRSAYHYVSYAVIRRGATSGSLFDIQGQTPLRTIYEPYRRKFVDNEVDWNYVSRYYDYIWSWNDRRAQQSISEVAVKVFEEGPLTIYRVGGREASFSR